MVGTNFGIYRPVNANNSTIVTTTVQQKTTQQATSTTTTTTAAVSPKFTQEHTQLNDFLLQLEDYTPTVPDIVTAFYLNLAGFDTNDQRIIRLISLVTQKFISDVANDALQHSKIRSNSENGPKVNKTIKDRKFTLTKEDLTVALANHGIMIRKAQYFT